MPARVLGFLLAGNIFCAAAAAGEAARPPCKVELSSSAVTEIERLIYGSSKMMRFSPELGWVTRQAANSGLYSSNSAAVRGRMEYSVRPGTGVFRVAAFGDSYVYGVDVADKDAWPALLTDSMQRAEVLNFGVPAYGLDQSLLRYRSEGKKSRPRVVLIGFLVPTLHRNLMTFRPFWSGEAGLPLSKPRFVLEKGKLRQVANPLASTADYRALLKDPASPTEALWRDDWFCRNGRSDAYADYAAASEGFETAAAILELFAQEVRRDGAEPVVIIFPDANMLVAGAGAVPGPLKERLGRAGIRYLDMLETLLRGGPKGAEAFYGPSGHFTPLANRVVAEGLAEYLSSAFGVRRGTAER